MVVTVVTGIALAIRWALLDQALFGDELFTYEVVTRPSFWSMLEGVRSTLEISPPLFFIVAWALHGLGDSVLWLRVPSLVAGAATVPAIYVLGRRTVGRDAAMVGAAMFALSPFAVFYATEARAYSLMTLLVVLSALALLRAVDTNDWRWWTTYSMLLAAAMYTHYTSLFVILSQLVWVLITHRERIRSLFISCAGAALLVVPWVPNLIADQQAPIQAAIMKASPFTLRNASTYLMRLMVGGTFTTLGDQPGVLALVLLAVAAGIGLVGLAWRWVRGPHPTMTHPALLVVMMAASAPVGVGIYSLGDTGLFYPRNLFSSLPAIALVIAAVLVALPPRLATLAVLLALTGLALGVITTFEPANRRPPYDQVAAFIESAIQPGDVVIELRPFRSAGPPGDSLKLYMDPRIPLLPPSKAGQADAVGILERTGGRLFYVRSAMPLLDSAPIVRFQLRFGRADPGRATIDRALRLVDHRSWDGLNQVTVYLYEPR